MDVKESSPYAGELFLCFQIRLLGAISGEFPRGLEAVGGG